jgi:hypothetical protein
LPGFNSVLTPKHNKKGAIQFEPPPKGVPSKMPLLIFLPEKYTNIPEVAR